MTENITIICDRCGIKVRGAKGPMSTVWGNSYWTSGYYDLTDAYWQQFALKGEKKICDECMLTDLRYQNR